jgi:hypothetical protein
MVWMVMWFLFVPPPNGNGQTPAKGKNATDAPHNASTPAVLFKGWSKPDLAIVLSGETHGYLQPCGCTRPQFGGLARRWNFLQSLKDRGWPVVCVDLGDLPQKTGPQTMLKYVTAMNALKLMNYTAIGVGEYEMGLPLADAASHFALNNPRPRLLAANLLNRGKGETFETSIASWELAGDGKTPRVGVLGLIGGSVEKLVKDPAIRCDQDTGRVLVKTLHELQAKQAELIVLLYQGSVAEAEKCAQFAADAKRKDPRLPTINVILCLTGDDNPSGIPRTVGNSILVGVGHKGRHVGVVGAFRTGDKRQPWQLRYQIVSIGEEYETPKGKDADNPIMALMEEYAEDVKDGNYLARVRPKQHPIQVDYPKARYVGSERCENCHKHAYDIWKDTGHAHAYQTLVKATRPKSRQYDPECVICHTVGFGYETGFKDAENSKKLLNVGCESCHGPGSAHANDPDDEKLRALMNPWKAKPNESKEARTGRMNQIDWFCQKCHDRENDYHWTFEKWQQIIHMTPRQPATPPQAPALKRGKEP